jgi:hypothetical protein
MCCIGAQWQTVGRQFIPDHGRPLRAPTAVVCRGKVPLFFARLTKCTIPCNGRVNRRRTALAIHSDRLPLLSHPGARWNNFTLDLCSRSPVALGLAPSRPPRFDVDLDSICVSAWNKWKPIDNYLEMSAPAPSVTRDWAEKREVFAGQFQPKAL